MTHVYEADLAGTHKIVRTLVTHPDLAEEVRILAMFADEQRLMGLELAVEDLDPNWRALDEPAPWKVGSVPVALTDEGTLVFSTHRDLRQKRLRWLAEQVSCALEDDQGESILHRVATLEHVDGILGGHALSSGALLFLAEEHSDAPEIGSYARLRSRFHAAAPDGLPSLQRELNRPAIREALAVQLADRIAGAARRAAQPNGAFTADAWTVCAERTLWSWWLHCKAGAAPVPLRELARRLEIPAHDLLVLARAEAVPQDVGAHEKLPSREDAVRYLDSSLRNQRSSLARVAFTQRAHQARLGLFVRQSSELGRLFTEERLTRWADVRDIVRTVRASLRLRSFRFPWQAAEFMSEVLLGHLQRAEGARSVTSLVRDVGGILAGTVLPFGGQQGAWHVEPDGAPALFLTPTSLALTGGARRFAVLHQLGHLVAGHDRGCTKWTDEEGGSHYDSAPEEKFANAFAAYLAAPRHTVRGLVGRPTTLTDAWLKAAARDVALECGLGSDAALPHVLNCLEQPVERWQRRSRAWLSWTNDVTGLVADRWSEDADGIFDSCGRIHNISVSEALGRPHSPVYDGLMRRAAAHDQIPPELLDAYEV